MVIDYRFAEACGLLPMLCVPLKTETKNTILCLGSQAEKLAAEVLRWRDTGTVHMLLPPLFLRDKRVVVGLPKSGSCAAVLSSPNEPGDPFLAALAKDGVFCASTYDELGVPVFMRNMRTLFPLGIKPWREHVPGVIYGILATPGGVPKRQRAMPGGAKRLSDTYMRCLVTFARDETPLVFGPQPSTVPVAEPVDAEPAQQPVNAPPFG